MAMAKWLVAPLVKSAIVVYENFESWAMHRHEIKDVTPQEKTVDPQWLCVISCPGHLMSQRNTCRELQLSAIRNTIDILNAAFLLFYLFPKRQRFLERILRHLAPDMRKKKLVGMCKTR
ncbi:hypothetical protein LSAT2_030227 [Lamellibrachia satsuma]|nr:hypothetical protein LSAT2_030227 [Lamellibrachia satsuma]